MGFENVNSLFLVTNIEIIFWFENWASGCVHFALKMWKIPNNICKLSKFTQKIQSYLIFPLLWLAPTFWTRNQKRGNLSILPTFLNEICSKLWKLIGYDKTEWFFEEKISNSDFFFMIYGLSSKSGCKGKLEKNQFVRVFWCYFEHLPNRRGMSNFGKAERMYVDAQFSKPFGSSYFH